MEQSLPLTSLPSKKEYREFIHRLNQRYKQEFDRAERLQAELANIHGSRAWQFLNWLRRIKKIFLPPVKKLPAPHFPTTPLEVATSPPTSTVSIVIPFRNEIGLLRNLLRSLQRTRYRRFKLILVDNGSTCPKTVTYVNHLRKKKRIQIVNCDYPFHFARLCNDGGATVRGQFLLFLNNDMEVLTSTWLEEMLRLAELPSVGIVGGTLLYPDGTLQHAGIFPEADGRRWTHPYRGCPGDYAGKDGELLKPREVPAVTAACLMIRRNLFRQMGGFSEEFAITGNDVDLCCRVRQRGLRVAITPHARLLHFECLSRGYTVDTSGEILARRHPVRDKTHANCSFGS